MSRPNYRVLLSYHSERKIFTARVPELPPCIGEGATRSEALANMERELEALLANLGEKGARIPAAIDELEASGELSAKVSRSLHRDLAFQAQLEGVELGQLVAELLASALEQRQRTGRPQRRLPQHAQEGHGDEPPRRSERHPQHHGNERGDREHDGRFRNERNTAARFHGLLEDRASFMEYVRGLEAEGGHGHSHGHGPGYGRSPRQGQDRDGGRRPPRDRGPGRRNGPGPSGGGAPPREDGGGVSG